MKLLRIQVERKETELYAHGEALKKNAIAKAIALSKGDLSENQDYKIAKEVEKDLGEKMEDLRKELRSAEEISIDSTNIFGLGSLLEVKIVGTPHGEFIHAININETENRNVDYLFLLPEGEMLYDGVLSVDTKVGSMIYNKESKDGVLSFTIDGYVYEIKKLGVESVDLFLEKHPESSAIADKLFG